MAYEKHEFANGDVLFAKDLNEMEDQIAANESKGAENAGALSLLSGRVTGV